MGAAISAAKRIGAAATLLGLSLLSQPALAAKEDGNAPAGLSGVYLSALIADAGKDLANAAAFYRQASSIDPENILLLDRALLLTAAAGDVDQAISLAEDLLAKTPDSRSARLVLAIGALGEGDYAGAIGSLRKAGAGILPDLTNNLLIAWAQFGQGDPDKALATIDGIQGESWYEPFKLLHSGLIAGLTGRNEQAVEDLQRAHELDTTAVRIAEAYARALALDGRKDEALAVLNDFLGKFPENPLALRALEEIRMGRNLPLLDAAEEGAAEALAGLGAAIGQEGGAEVAALYLQLALHLDPNSGGGLASLSLGNVLEATGQGEAAIAVFEAIEPQAPFRSVGLLRAALALDRLDRVEEAETALKQAIERNPDDVQAYLSYGNMLRGRERFAEAAEIYSEAIERVGSPRQVDWPLFYFRGIAYERSQQWPKAEADFKKALELYPDQPLVLNYLGYSWVDKGMNLEPALDMIRKAVELRPNDGYIVDSLGWAYYRLGRYEDAVEELERAISLMPQDPVLNDHLGDAYWQVGRRLEAQFQWRHARDLGAEEPDLSRIRRKIAEGRLIEENGPVEEKSAALGEGGEAPSADEVYIVQAGDTLRGIAAKLLGDSTAFERLIEENRDVLRGRETVSPGMRLKIPEKL